MKPCDVAGLASWLIDQEKKLTYGEIIIKIVKHDGQLRAIEKTVTERERPEVD